MIPPSYADLLDENHKLHTRVQELEAEVSELREENAWDRKDQRPKVASNG